MPRLPKRLPYELAIAGALMVGSCAKMPHSFSGEDYDRLDVADVNARNAIYRVDALESRVEELQGRFPL